MIFSHDQAWERLTVETVIEEAVGENPLADLEECWGKGMFPGEKKSSGSVPDTLRNLANFKRGCSCLK